MEVKRTGVVLKPNNSRVVMRPFDPTSEHRAEKIIARVASLAEPEVERLLAGVMGEFRFKVGTLNGTEVRNKGFALFPRPVDGQYAMLSRQDNENIYLMYSDMPHFWFTKELIARPTYPWEFVQLGNCGSPIETEAGWLVLTHGVGPMRKYALGAFLLGLDDPSRVIGRLETPLLEPDANEREGYVPNVVYSCGALLHGRGLVIPYAMSDYASTFATVPVDDVLGAMARP